MPNLTSKVEMNIGFGPPEGRKGGEARVEDIEGRNVGDGNMLEGKLVVILPLFDQLRIVTSQHCEM